MCNACVCMYVLCELASNILSFGRFVDSIAVVAATTATTPYHSTISTAAAALLLRCCVCLLYYVSNVSHV